MKKVVKLLSVMFFMSGCGEEATYSSPSLNQQVKSFVESVESQLKGCDVYGIMHPGRPDCNLDDYSAGPGGFGCLSGNQQACYTMSLTISDDGKPYRSYKNKLEGDSVNEYSRDQLYGFFAYLIKTKDVNSAQRLLGYIERVGKLCEGADDNRCDMTPAAWGLMSKVWKYLGLKRSSSMIVNDLVDDLVVSGQMETVEVGYQLGLQMEFVFLSKMMGYESVLMRNAAKIGFDRQRKNPFYCYVVNGVNDYCKRLFLEWFKEGAPLGRENVWTLSRREDDLDSRLNSMGYEAVFLGNLLSD